MRPIAAAAGRPPPSMVMGLMMISAWSEREMERKNIPSSEEEDSLAGCGLGMKYSYSEYYSPCDTYMCFFRWLWSHTSQMYNKLLKVRKKLLQPLTNRNNNGYILMKTQAIHLYGYTYVCMSIDSIDVLGMNVCIFFFRWRLRHLHASWLNWRNFIWFTKWNARNDC